jgi:hypothetical protein
VSTIEIFANGRAAFGAENRKSKQPTRTSATTTDPDPRRLERKTARADAVEVGTATSARADGENAEAGSSGGRHPPGP